MNTRAACARALVLVIRDGRSLSSALPAEIKNLPGQDQGLAQELAYGVLRWFHRLNGIIPKLMSRPLKAADTDIQALILMGFYQLLHTRIPAHAAVAETVEATRKLGKPWAEKLVNGVLRTFQREQDALLGGVDAQVHLRYAHPRWLAEAFETCYPGHGEDVMAANQARPPMNLRVNRQKTSREDYLELLKEADIEALASDFAPEAIRLVHPVDVSRLPGFDEGLVSVQDEAAQLAAHLLELAPGLRVLDACAAPGGKSAHILETEPGVQLLALDSDERRAGKIEQTFARLDLDGDWGVFDAAKPDTWWDEEPFDRILVDAPCSATGVIRRHPDIKLLRKAKDIPNLAVEQARLLHKLWPLLKPGGILVYATCSVLPAENSAQIANFLERHADAEEIAIAPDGAPEGPGWQILPQNEGPDGFYYAKLRKNP
ncbi:MAG: 16S rRNA (cytosine(967)-C(5))-methyltransferase RsmB [Gammaproteobacteria bacterium]|nr:16S rRNA (cytosine(967)-C(5))-methyltransferase RsmB [Gammaproteobacteria bacterium]